MIRYNTIIKCKTVQCCKSICAILPKRFVKESNIKPYEEIFIEIKSKKENILKEFFGKGKHLHINAQKVKGMLRKEWYFF